MRKAFFGLIILGFVLSIGVTSADAASILCPGTPAGTDREFQLTTAVAAVCRASGVGSLSGTDDFISDVLDGVDFWTTLDKSDDSISGLMPALLTSSGSGTTGPGTFAFDPAIWTTFGRIIIAFKSGQGQLDPDWAAFELPFGISSGSWAIVTGPQALSHINIYGHPGSLLSAPEPASLVLLGAGLTVVVARLRRRRPQSR